MKLLSKQEVNYRAGREDYRCDRCRLYRSTTCRCMTVYGFIYPDDRCDRFQVRRD